MSLWRKSKPAGRQRVHSEAPARRRDSEPNTGRGQQKTPGQGSNLYLQRLGLIILLLAVVAGLTNAMTLSAYPKVLPLNGSATSPFLRNSSDYEKAASDQLKKSIWNRNKLTVDADGISRQLTAQFPELASATMTLPLVAHRPLIYVQPATPVLVLNARNGSFIVADTGKALLRGNSAQDLAAYKLPPVNDQSGLKLQVGHRALSGKDVKFIQTVKTQLAAKGITIESMTLPANASELDLKAAGQAYTVKFNLHSDKARQQAGTYLATLDYLKKHNAVPAKYIDVRVDGRSYYQ